MTQALDIGHLRRWIGREETATDGISARLVRSLRATLDERPGEPAEGEEAPPSIHWCLAPSIVANGDTGEDGHPRRGGFLPPVPLPRRMWAGGEIEFADRLRVGDEVRRVSSIVGVDLKEGRAGRLVFVTVRHDYATGRGPAISERQDIVYRNMPGAAEQSVAPRSSPPPAAPQLERGFDVTPLALFRFSALTFNGHRIHYDRRYCQDEEGYPGLVVHGPLQATLLLQLATEALGAVPGRFTYRGVAPLFEDDGLHLEARSGDAGWSLRARNGSGTTTMEATASAATGRPAEFAPR